MTSPGLCALRASLSDRYAFSIGILAICLAMLFVANVVVTATGTSFSTKEDYATGVSQKFFNKAFVVIGYFAFLRRDPDAAYLVWLDKLNTTGDYREMIRGFIQSQEFRFRFGPT